MSGTEDYSKKKKKFLRLVVWNWWTEKERIEAARFAFNEIAFVWFTWQKTCPKTKTLLVTVAFCIVLEYTFV